MLLSRMHREDVKAAIRKRFGSVAAFERAKGLTERSVNELFRGRTNNPARRAIEAMLSDTDTPGGNPEHSGFSRNAGLAHRLNRGVK